jgi:sulfur-carrier protein adenylyltransferase/sulfurtransferase
MRFSFALEALQGIALHASESAPHECCGVLVGDSSGLVLRVVQVQNAAANAKDSYEIDPFALERIYDEVVKSGLWVVGVYHSHVEVGAYFSSADRRLALDRGEPTYPLYVVAGVRAERCDELKAFCWDGRNFIEEPLFYI